MSTYYNASSLGIGDAGNDQRARVTLREITAQLAAFGFVQTADAGQITTSTLNAANGWVDQPLSATPWNPPAVTNAASNMFDGSTATNLSVALVPSSASPVAFNYDSGVGVTNTAASYKVYFANATSDIKTWFLQGSNDFTFWTTLDTQTNVVPGAAGYQTYAIASPGAYRYYRLYVTANNGSGTTTVMTEWQLITSGAVVFSSGTSCLFNASSTATINLGYQVWRFNDALQATAPCYFKLEFVVCGATTLQMWFTIGNSSNGSGTITGTGVMTRMVFNAATSNSAQGRSAYSGSNNGSRVSMAGGFNNVSNTWLLVLERTKDGSGVDTGVGVCFLIGAQGSSNRTQIFQGVCRCDGNPSISPETAIGVMNTSSSTTMIRAGVVGVGECVCFIGQRQNAMLSFIGYKLTDMTALVPFTATVNGSLHTYLPLGCGNQDYARQGTTSDAGAILWE